MIAMTEATRPKTIVVIISGDMLEMYLCMGMCLVSRSSVFSKLMEEKQTLGRMVGDFIALRCRTWCLAVLTWDPSVDRIGYTGRSH